MIQNDDAGSSPGGRDLDLTLSALRPEVRFLHARRLRAGNPSSYEAARYQCHPSALEEQHLCNKDTAPTHPCPGGAARTGVVTYIQLRIRRPGRYRPQEVTRLQRVSASASKSYKDAAPAGAGCFI